MCKQDKKIHHVFRRPSVGEFGLPEMLNANVELWQDIRAIQKQTVNKEEHRYDE